MKRFSTLLSWIFMPLFIPIYGLLIMLYLPIHSSSFVAANSLFLLPSMAKMLFVILFVIFLVLAPGASIFILKQNNTISSISLEKKEERQVPIAITGFYGMILFLFLLYQTKEVYFPSILLAMVIGGCLASLLAYFLNRKIKVSLHSLGMGSLLGLLYMFAIQLDKTPVFLLIAIILLSGLVLSARLYLKAHSMKEIGLGYLIGFASQVICIYFYP